LLPLVSIGDSILAGQVIARLINTETSHLINEYTARLREAEEQLAVLKQGARPQEIEEARNTVREMQAKLDQASLNLTRINEMYAKNLVAKQAWEDARADSLVWDARLKGAQNRLYLLKAGTRPEEIKAKEAEIDRLKSQIDFHSRQQDAYEIKATISGMVLHLDTGETVCEIANLDTMEAMITLSEKELADIGLGQKVKFKVRGYPELSFYGDVYRIDNKIVENVNGERVFQTACLVPNDAHLLRPGMTGVANVYCGKRKIGHHIYRKFFRTIRTEFWDWFDWL
jgi:HlyD family secretion protein